MSANFITLDSSEKLDELFDNSAEKPVILFKHSNSCPISADVYREVSKANADINLVVVQAARDISNDISERTAIRHESPQAIVLKDGKPIYHASHYDIVADDLEAAVKQS